MCKTAVIDSSCTNIGLLLRNQTSGPELAMLKSYADRLISTYASLRGTSRYLLLFEPRLDSGYPDLVVLRYTESFMRRWNTKREALEIEDLKVLSFLCSRRSVSEEIVSNALGFSNSRVRRSLSSLQACDIVASHSDQWRVLDKSHLLGLKEVISFEAKVQAAENVYKQALCNTRFSTSSLAILGSKKPSRRTVARFEGSGIGLLSDGGARRMVEPRQRKLPNSYIAFLFNEWLGRCLSQGVIS